MSGYSDADQRADRAFLVGADFGRAQVRAQVEAAYSPHRDSIPSGFQDQCVCVGCNVYRAALPEETL